MSVSPPSPSGTDDESDGEGDPEAVTVEEGPGGREVVVPLALYKRVTVFSTLIAMVCIVGGFVVLDRATNRARLPVSEVDPWLALAGLGLIAAGAGTYAFSTRFRAAGMGRSKTDENGASDDG